MPAVIAHSEKHAHGADREASDEHSQADRVVVARRDLARAVSRRSDRQYERGTGKKFQIKNWLSFMSMAPDTSDSWRTPWRVATSCRPAPLSDGFLPHLQAMFR
jgi:hypothetical protein